MIDFRDMDDLDSAPVKPEGAARAAAQPAPHLDLVICPKCSGRGDVGVYRPMQCFRCKGSGRVRQIDKARSDAHRKGEITKAANKRARAAEWREANPAEAAWLREGNDRGFTFAESLSNALEVYGSLTDNQLAAVRRCMEQDAERKVEKAKAEAANAVDVSAGAEKIRDALNRAHGNGLKAPKLRTGEVDFSRAKDASRNPGCVYVTKGELYLGKIDPAGAFIPSRDCGAEMKLLVAKVAADPLAAAVEHGRMSGVCSCCGRQLDNEESVRLGIGPICRKKYFGGA